MILNVFPLAAIAAPLAGRWHGEFHGGRGNQALTLVCRPRTGGMLAGLLYMGDDLMGPLANGTYSADSLHFRVLNYDFLGSRGGDRMDLQLLVPHGRTHDVSLRFVSPDTSALAQTAESATVARKSLTPPWDQVPDSVFVQHRMAAGVPPRVAPGVRAGTLFLVGGGPSQEDLDAEFLRLAGGPSARIVVIPTASVDPRDSSGALLSADRWASTLGASKVTVLHTTSRVTANSEAFVRPLRDATGVWLSGGEGGRITGSYLGTRTERELLALLARGGVVGGTSAGALMWGSDCMVFRMPEDGSPFEVGDLSRLWLDAPHSECFGVLQNMVMAPHFTEFRMLPSLMKMIGAKPRLLGIGVDEATALEVHGDSCLVIGRGHVTLVDARGRAASQPIALGAGSRFELSKAPRP